MSSICSGEFHLALMQVFGHSPIVRFVNKSSFIQVLLGRSLVRSGVNYVLMNKISFTCYTGATLPSTGGSPCWSGLRPAVSRILHKGKWT